MPLPMQAKLLRVLEQGEFERIGGDKPVKVNVRVVVATHRNLEDQVKQGGFRQDLFHRIFVFPVVLPPLRERTEDIPALAKHFAAQIAAQNGWKELSFDADAIHALQAYTWPGNIRELRNVVERLLIFTEGEVIRAAPVRTALPAHAVAASSGAFSGTLSQQVEQFERHAILEEIKRQNHHITNAAKALGLERSHLYKKCQQLGIDLREVRKP
jgi:DNA-binding NtrC family response regulator